MNNKIEESQGEDDLTPLGSLVVGSIKDAIKDCLHKCALPPVGVTPFESWRRRLSYGDRLPRGRFFVGKRPGGISTVQVYKEFSYYEVNGEQQ